MNHNQLLAAYFTPAVGIVANNNLLRQHFSKAVMAIKVKIDVIVSCANNQLGTTSHFKKGGLQVTTRIGLIANCDICAIIFQFNVCTRVMPTDHRY